jgi:hypothetical protein
MESADKYVPMQKGMEPYIKCRTGRKFDYVKPDPKTVYVHDVAHAAGNICRFNGHTRTFFSIAQHMTEAAQLSMRKTLNKGILPSVRRDMAYACLIHDAHESYIGDWPSPLKLVLGEDFRKVERPIIVAVEEAFGVTQSMEEHRKHVKEVDLELLYSDAIRWGMDGTITIDDIEYGDPRDWVPNDAVIHFQDAVPLVPDEATDNWIAMFELLKGPNRCLYDTIAENRHAA